MTSTGCDIGTALERLRLASPNVGEVGCPTRYNRLELGKILLSFPSTQARKKPGPSSKRELVQMRPN
jgi:hypothetical protein